VAFEPGRLVLRRHFMREEMLARVWLTTVAADDDAGLWLWVGTGSGFLDIGAADGRGFRDVPFGQWRDTAKALQPKVWQGDALILHPRDQAHSVFHFFRPDGSFSHYYVNLEEPLVRWDDGALAGIDTVDQDLDIVAEATLSWRWKDEDEFADHLAYPETYWVPDPDAVWSEGRRVIAMIEAGTFPFDGARSGFRADPEWTIPTVMPLGWERPRAWPRPRTS
jgi:hypothetical protein